MQPDSDDPVFILRPPDPISNLSKQRLAEKLLPRRFLLIPDIDGDSILYQKTIAADAVESREEQETTENNADKDGNRFFVDLVFFFPGAAEWP